MGCKYPMNMCFVDFFGCLEVLRIFFLGERCFFCDRTCLEVQRLLLVQWTSMFSGRRYNLGCGFPLPGFRSPTHLPLERVSHTNLPPFPGTFRTTIPASNSFTPLAYAEYRFFAGRCCWLIWGWSTGIHDFFLWCLFFENLEAQEVTEFFEKYEPRLPPLVRSSSSFLISLDGYNPFSMT